MNTEPIKVESNLWTSYYWSAVSKHTFSAFTLRR